MRLLTSPRCSQVSFSLAFNLNCSFWKWYTDSSGWRQAVSTFLQSSNNVPHSQITLAPVHLSSSPAWSCPCSPLPTYFIPKLRSWRKCKEIPGQVHLTMCTRFLSALFPLFHCTDTNLADTSNALWTPVETSWQCCITNNTPHVQAAFTWDFKAYLRSCINIITVVLQ